MKNSYARMSGRELGKAEKPQLVEYIKADKDFMGGIRRGVRDCKAGKVRLWSEIKKELNIL